jgi:hypothetical protein
MAGPRAPAAATTAGRASPSTPPRALLGQSLLPHPTRLRLQFQFFSRPGHPLAIRFRAGSGGSSATGMMGENGLVTRSRRLRHPRSVDGRRTRGGRKVPSKSRQDGASISGIILPATYWRNGYTSIYVLEQYEVVAA